MQVAAISHSEDDLWSRLEKLHSYIKEATTMLLYILKESVIVRLNEIWLKCYWKAVNYTDMPNAPIPQIKVNCLS